MVPFRFRHLVVTHSCVTKVTQAASDIPTVTSIACSSFGAVTSSVSSSQSLAATSGFRVPVWLFLSFASCSSVEIPMADTHARLSAPSPISQLLKTLGMTREDLVQHTEQMRAHLSQTSSSQPPERVKSKSRSFQRSRTASLSNLAGRALSATPPMTPVKSEPVEHGIPVRQMDTMQLVMERKSRQTKRERRGVVFFASWNAAPMIKFICCCCTIRRFPLAFTRQSTRFPLSQHRSHTQRHTFSKPCLTSHISRSLTRILIFSNFLPPLTTINTIANV